MQSGPQEATQLSWALQFALTTGIGVACGGVAITFKRPAMRALAATFFIVTVAAGVIWAAASASDASLSPSTTTLLVALSTPLTPVLTFLFFRQIVLVIAGRSSRAIPATLHIVTASAAGFVVSLTIALLTAPSGPIVVAVVATAGAFISFVWLALLSWRSRVGAGPRAWSLELLQWSFTALAVRSSLNVVVAAIAYANGTRPSFSMSVTLVQAFLLVIAAVLQIIAVLDEERAHGLAQADQLRQAEVGAARSQRLESLGRMAGGVAHDFNNVLTVILSGAQSALAAGGNDVREELTEIEAAAKRGHDLTRQLLSFARQTPERVARFDANAQLGRLRSMLQRIVGSPVTLNVIGSEAPLYVDMDSTQFDQLVMNLVTNARDATPTGGTIGVRLSAAPPDHKSGGADAGADDAKFVRLTVADTGAGIPDQVLPHIFDPFFTTKKAGEGTGLGLATCDGIVRRLGGRIDVKSDPATGTQFDVLIPRAPAP